MHDTTLADAKPSVKPVSPDDIQHTDSLAYVPTASAKIIANGSLISPSRQPRWPPRPQTAPSQEHTPLLPSSSRGHTISLPSSPHRETPPRECSTLRDALQQNLAAAGDVTVDKGSVQWDRLSGPGASSAALANCDWATFIAAYAMGRWDPHKIPNQPRSYHSFPDDSRITETMRESDSSPLESLEFTSAEGTPGLSTSSIPPKASRIQRRAAIDLPLQLSLPVPPYRMRSSFSSATSTSNSTASTSTATSNADLTTTVAAMRWAAARVDISPLALPSPEHELTDPMRGVTASLPHDDCSVENVITPGGGRRSRLASFWEGTTDVDVMDSPKIVAVPLGGSSASRQRVTADNNSIPFISRQASETTPTQTSYSNATPHSSSRSPSNALSDPTTQLSLLAAAPPATAPILGNGSQSSSDGSDYFGDAVIPPPKPKSGPPATYIPSAPDFSCPGELSTVEGTLTVPALPRRVCLTRQTSSPLPMSHCLQDARLSGGRTAVSPTSNVLAMKAGRAAKEEQMFNELGYLAPPNPPDELERRRALYKFNIWNTGPDLNFDRIAHLAKLVFNTRGVVISLIDGNEQWFKSEFGSLLTQGGARSHPRTQSLCGHAILQQGDEPMMVLDTQKDWRFAKNPLVTGPTHIRFYAGAPLRTQDGYNIGTLAVIDDVPRDDFTPRQRHTLKEFAAIAMREMELWRDKIQLRIRDRIQSSMEQFSRECLENDNEIYAHGLQDLTIGTSMEKVYDRAAKLVQSTLDVEGVIVMDVSHCDVLENMSAEGTVSVILHHGDTEMEMEKRQISTEEYHQFNRFFQRHPDGKVLEGIMPHLFRPYMPTHIRYALTVPIFNIDKRPFALICAYNTNDHSKRFLEGHELSYLRAIGVIILSAVLKRRMILADKAKSLFISNISHELRTPLHGILAAAELLSDSPLSHSQMSFIQTVQACGTSLVETVNHVLDFTKLSGNSKAGGVDKVILPTVTDLMSLIEDAIDGSWIGHRARTATGDSLIGSVYSPPNNDGDNSSKSPSPQPEHHVETVIDIGFREEGWLLTFEKGGIRRVLMNLFGNSLKFTTDGYVHVKARLLPRNPQDPQNRAKVELSVEDTGKGMSRNFLKNQLFHPFSQENPLQTGTGLGLAIVSSIVTSANVGGKVDVWSEEGAGTEIRVTFPVEMPDNEAAVLQASQEMQPFNMDDGSPLPSVSMVGFDSPHRGIELLKTVTLSYLSDWWKFPMKQGPEMGDIVITNDDLEPLNDALERKDVSKAFIILWSARGDHSVLNVTNEYERMGGICSVMYKPGGPTRLRAAMKRCIHTLKIGHYLQTSPPQVMPGYVSHAKSEADRYSSAAWRRNSDESYKVAPKVTPSMRPSMSRANTANPLSSLRQVVSGQIDGQVSPVTTTLDPSKATISIGSGGSLLKSAVRLSSVDEVKEYDWRPRVLVVEDNSILRNLLVKWLAKKGYDYEEAVDGLQGVNIYRDQGPFDVVLIDLSMPVLDGVAATQQMRQIEAESGANTKGDSNPDAPTPPSPNRLLMLRTKILALTGMSSLEDKRRAFDAGVDGYLVKPVAFKTLDDMFSKLGIS